LNDILETGRGGLLVDFPETEGVVTVAEAEELAVRSNIVAYKTEQIKDWDVTKVNAAMKLSFVKLEEKSVERSQDDIFKTEEVTRYRVLLLDEGIYKQRLYDEEGNYSEIIPTDKNGVPFDYITFYFIGSVNNRPNVDPAPLIEIAEVNLAHYRNSADFEESSFTVGQPTAAVTGLNQAWAKEFMKEGVKMGSRNATLLPEGGDLKLIQVQANTMPENGMTRKERQMIELGARLITSGGGAETAEAARIKHSADASVLSVIVSNINQAYQDAIKAVQQFMSGTMQEFTFKLNEDFFAAKMTAEELNALVMSWQSGAISKAVLDDNLVNGGVISEDTDLEEMNDSIENTPSNLSFDV